MSGLTILSYWNPGEENNLFMVNRVSRKIFLLKIISQFGTVWVVTVEIEGFYGDQWVYSRK